MKFRSHIQKHPLAWSVACMVGGAALVLLAVALVSTRPGNERNASIEQVSTSSTTTVLATTSESGVAPATEQPSESGTAAQQMTNSSSGSNSALADFGTPGNSPSTYPPTTNTAVAGAEPVTPTTSPPTTISVCKPNLSLKYQMMNDYDRAQRDEWRALNAAPNMNETNRIEAIYQSNLQQYNRVLTAINLCQNVSWSFTII